MNPKQPVDIARILLVIVILSALMVGSLYILRPFLPGLIWATTIVVATWPVMLAVQRRCGNRRWLATAVMLIILLVVIVLPLYEAISTLALHGSDIMAAIKEWYDQNPGYKGNEARLMAFQKAAGWTGWPPPAVSPASSCLARPASPPAWSS